MRKIFYLLFTLFLYESILAQKPKHINTSTLTKEEIDKKLDSIAKSSRQKQEQNFEQENRLLIALKKNLKK